MVQNSMQTLGQIWMQINTHIKDRKWKLHLQNPDIFPDTGQLKKYKCDEIVLYHIVFIGARGRTRTGKGSLPRDFKSLASTNFATRAAESGASL